MFERIVVATDGSHSAEKAVEYAVAFAGRHGSKLYICTVTRERLATIPRGDEGEPSPPDVDRGASLSRGQADQAAEVLRRAEQVAKAAGVDYELREFYGTNAGATIVKEAETVGADHVVVGSVGSTGLSRLLMGSVASSVVHHAHCPVTVVR